MPLLSYERHCAELLAQTRLLTSHIATADRTAPVPSCPGWQLVHLLRHLGGTHRWAERAVRERATVPVPDDEVNDVSGRQGDPAVFGDWLTDGAARLADTLRAAGPDTPVWNPSPEAGTAAFWARRMTHETVVHRYDAAMTAGADFTVAPEVAADAVGEYLEFGSLPPVFEPADGAPVLLGPGRTLHFQPTDSSGTEGTPAPGWLLDLTGECGGRVVRQQPSANSSPAATTTVRGPLTELLLTLYGRRPASGGGLEVRGDARLLERWLERSRFWLE